MDAVFQTVLKMSLSASVLAATVMLLRLVLKKAPKWIACCLWALVALRLLCPVSPESSLSLMPDTEPVTQQVMALQPTVSSSNIMQQENGQPVEIQPDTPAPQFVFRFWMAWVFGVAGMLLYMLISYLAVRKRVWINEPLDARVRRCDYITTPFILGLVHPKIYLPSSLPESSRAYVIAHEQAHLKRKDHWWKPLGFLLLSIHWFNPVMWLAYILLCRDIELACDEKVIRDMAPEEKTAYSEALLQSSVRQKYITACPLAFGEVGVKARIQSILHYKKPAFWILLVALLASVALAVFFLTDRPEGLPNVEPPTTSHTPTALKTLEAVVLKDHGFMIEARFERDYQTYEVFIKTDHLPDLPVFEKWDKIIVAHSMEDSPFDGQLDQVSRIKKVETTPVLNGHLEGMVMSQTGDYVQLRVDSSDGSMMVYVNIRKFPDLQVLKKGDMVMVHYEPGVNPSQIDDPTEVRRTQVADWGVIMRASSVTPTGFRLYYGAASGWPRDLKTTDAYYLEKKENNEWVAVQGMLEGAFSTRVYSFGGGNYQNVNWQNIYGELAPGQYRYCRTLSYEGEDRVYNVEFTIHTPLATDLEGAVTQTVRYILSKQLVNPARPHDKSLEHIPQDEETGFLDEPIAGEDTGKTFQQITESHMILDQKQSGDTYTLTIAGMCRGYNNRLYKEEFFSVMLLVMRKNADGTYQATSCKMPTNLYYQADMELLFPAEMVQRILEDSVSHRDALEIACDKQVTGGIIQLKGFGKEFQSDSMEAKVILQAVASGKPRKKAYSDASVCTIFLDDTVYYYYHKAGIIHNVTEDVYTQLTDEGKGTLKTILGLIS